MSDLGPEAPLNRRLFHDRPGRAFLEVEESRWGELIQPAPDESPGRGGGLRVVAVTSFLYAEEFLGALVAFGRERPGELELVAVATDDAINAEAKIGLRKRVWKHYSQEERMEVEVATVEAALTAGVEVYTGELKIDWFHRQLREWKPDVMLVCGCGQIFDAAILSLPTLGVYNFHPSDLAHGHGAGAQPYEDVATRRDRTTRWTVHQMVEQVDAGPIVGSSPPICVADRDGVLTPDPKRFYAKLKGVSGPMVGILCERLVALRRDPNRPGGLGHIDFERHLAEQVKDRMAEPLA